MDPTIQFYILVALVLIVFGLLILVAKKQS